MSDEQETKSIGELRKQIAKLEKVNAVLIEEADRRARAATTSYDLFRAASVLEEQVATRTARLKEAQQQLEQSLSLVRATLDSTADGILVVACDGTIVDYNDKCVELWGIPRATVAARDRNKVMAKVLRQVKDPNAFMQRVLEIHANPDMEAFDELLLKDGRVVERYSMPQRLDGKTIGRVYSFRDVTERKRSERLSARLGRILDSSSNEIYVFDAETLQFIQVNQSAQQNIGYSQDELRQLTPMEVMTETERVAFQDTVAPLRDGAAEELVFEARHRRRDGTTYPVEVHLQLSRAERPAVFVAIVQDITDRKRADERLRYLANYDSLTNLPNRVLFRDRLLQALARAQRQSTPAALIFMDVDRFKSVNDTLGHSAGDRLLQAVAERIRSCLRSVDTFARLGGDEFTIVLSDIASPEAAAVVARKILDTFKRPFAVEGHEIYSSASIGITLYPTDATDIESLLRNADSAMYLAKEQGRGNYQFYTSEMNTRAQERLVLESSLRRAEANGELLLHYQPQVNIETGEVIGLEALLRWQHPTLGMLAPDKFIPLAEETGMIIGIGEWALRNACLQWRRWCDAGLRPVQMAVNMSVRQFRQPNMADTVGRILRETGMDASYLELEMTEGSLMTNADASSGILEKLKALHIRLAIDDFGTGYSSLNYLKRFPIDTVKVDRSFVSDIGVDPNDAAITHAIIALARALDLTVVAEGVETEEQLAFLRQQKCHAAQGYLFGRPVPAASAAQWLRPDVRAPSSGARLRSRALRARGKH